MDHPTYGERLRIGWLMLWRVLASFFGLVFLLDSAILTLQPELRRAEPSVWVMLLPVLVALLLAVFVMTPLISTTLLRKHFRGFRLELVREAGTPDPKIPAGAS